MEMKETATPVQAAAQAPTGVQLPQAIVLTPPAEPAGSGPLLHPFGVEIPWQELELTLYFKRIDQMTSRAYNVAENCRSKGVDVETSVEIQRANDIAARVEGTVGPPGCAARIRELLKEKGGSRDAMVLQLVKEMIDGKFGYFDSKDELIYQCVKTSLAVWTEGILAASTEGVTRAKIIDNSDGTKCVAIYFAGPISSAGGTAKAQAVLIADYVRKLLGLDAYKPTETEVERYVEEINLYHNAVSHMQLKPKDDDLAWIIRNCPVCMDGEGTDPLEVSAFKNLPRVESNRVRGGMCKVVCEGVAQKALKVLKLAKSYGLDWAWLEKVIKIEKKGDEQVRIKPVDSFLADIVGGRPILAYPSMPGGFRLRYGRGRNSGINAKCVHPSLMYALSEFIAVGTQLKIERPGKGAGITPCDTIEPPVVLMNSGDVVRLDDVERARQSQKDIKEILFLGDLLVCFGDFVKSNHNLMPSGIVEEWWVQLGRQRGLNLPRTVPVEEALEYSRKYGLPLHPRYTYLYNTVSKDEVVELVRWLSSSSMEKNKTLDGRELTRIVCEMNPAKRVLEKACVPHRVVDGRVVIDESEAAALTACFNLPYNEDLDSLAGPAQTALELVNALSAKNGILVWDKAPTYIGGRMGRPEKAKERLMSPAPHGLVPVGDHGGKVRSIIKAAEKGHITVDLPYLVCPQCKHELFGYKCLECNTRAMLVRRCSNCGKICTDKKCDKCGGEALGFHKAATDLQAELKKAQHRVGEAHLNPKLKGVIGMMNETKSFEPLEKAILRAKHNVHVFKDGTIRFDASNLTMLYFKPAEIGLGVDKARELGYVHDYTGAPLTDANQVCELKCQDIVVAEYCSEHLTRVAGFVDDLITKFYGESAFYNFQSQRDLIGQLVISIAPHTSAGVIGRIIGTTHGRAIFAHPYFHTAQRRDCDGDEDAVMLLMDGLLNFSKRFLPERIGGKMDAPLVLTTRIDPSEVDDQAHEMEMTYEYPIEFYEACQRFATPSSVKMRMVKNELGKPTAFYNFGFTHGTTKFDAGPNITAYVQLKTMAEKVHLQLEIASKIRAVDERDVATRVINYHFMRDLYGNLRTFGQQTTRCVDCNAKYRRVPLSGKCWKCGGKIILTVTRGGIEKYLRVSKEIADHYGLSEYLKQRLKLIEIDLNQIFTSDKNKQFTLADFA